MNGKVLVGLLALVAGGLLVLSIVKLLVERPVQLNIVAPEPQYYWLSDGDTFEVSSPVTVTAGSLSSFVLIVDGQSEPAALTFRQPGAGTGKYYRTAILQLQEGDSVKVQGARAEVVFEPPLGGKLATAQMHHHISLDPDLGGVFLVELLWIVLWCLGMAIAEENRVFRN